jgi:hypothetical protein
MFRVVGGGELSPSGMKIDSPDQLTNFISLQPKSEKHFFHPKLPDVRKGIAFWRVLRFRPFVLLVKGTCK